MYRQSYCSSVEENEIYFVYLQFKKAPSGEDLPDTLKHVKFSSMAWTHDHKGIFYNVSDKTLGWTVIRVISNLWLT